MSASPRAGTRKPEVRHARPGTPVSHDAGTDATLVSELAAAREQVAQLEQALHSRIVIEQAKGVLRERFGWTVDEAFAILRDAARRTRTKIHVLAGDVVEAESTPSAIMVALARSARWRAAHMSEHAELQRERASQLEVEVRRQQERLAWKQAEARRSRQVPERASDQIHVTASSESSAEALAGRVDVSSSVEVAPRPSGQYSVSWCYGSMPEWPGHQQEPLRFPGDDSGLGGRERSDRDHDRRARLQHETSFLRIAPCDAVSPAFPHPRVPPGHEVARKFRVKTL
jgi:ANTAR domain